MGEGGGVLARGGGEGGSKLGDIMGEWKSLGVSNWGFVGIGKVIFGSERKYLV